MASPLKRQGFPGTVATRARMFAHASCIGDETFCRCFDNADLSGIRIALSRRECRPLQQLHNVISKLEALLCSFPRESLHDLLFTVVFDEVHGLMARTERKGLVIASNRIISIISGHRVWYFFLYLRSQYLANFYVRIMPHGMDPCRIDHHGVVNLS